MEELNNSSEQLDNINDEVHFVATRRNGRALFFRGFYYHINKSIEERSYWKCRVKNCRSTIVTINDVISSISGVHIHGPEGETPEDQAPTLFRSRKRKLLPKDDSQNDDHYHSMSDGNDSLALVPITNNVADESMVSQQELTEFDTENSLDDSDGHYLEVEKLVQTELKEFDSQTELEDYDNQSLSLLPKPGVAPSTKTVFHDFSIQLTTAINVIGQTGIFEQYEINKLMSDWCIWQKRINEWQRERKVKPVFSSKEKEVENLKLQLEIAVSAKQEAERELRNTIKHKNELESNLKILKVSLQNALQNELFNGSRHDHCTSLLNEISELRRKVCSQVDLHTSKVNEVKKLLCNNNNLQHEGNILDSDEYKRILRERDEAMKANETLTEEVEQLRNQLIKGDKSPVQKNAQVAINNKSQSPPIKLDIKTDVPVKLSETTYVTLKYLGK